MEYKIYRSKDDKGQLMRRIHDLMNRYKSFELFSSLTNTTYCKFIVCDNYYLFRKDDVTVAFDKLIGGKYTNEFNDSFLRLDLYNNHVNIARAFVWWVECSIKIISS